MIRFALVLFLTTLVGTASAAVELPDIGSSSSVVLSPEKEQQIGQEMVRQLRRAGKLVDDRPLQEYIADLGARLTASLSGDRKFTFYVIDDPSINAFAMPGGYIGVNAGLIRATRTEDELAAVIAHEMAHVTQNHIARSFQKASEMNLPVTAAVLAAIILGGQDPQLSQAAIAASIAGSTQTQLDFTRAHEEEADRVGIDLLAKAGFNPAGMPDFFQRLQRQTRYYQRGLPEFLSTHPVTTARIADSQARAAQMHVSRHKSDRMRYLLVRTKLDVEERKDADTAVKVYRDKVAKSTGDEGQAARYGYALALTRAGRFAPARNQLQRLRKGDPSRILYIEAAARLEQRAGKAPAAIGVYRAALKLYPQNPTLTLELTQVLLQNGAPEQAQALLRDYTRAHETDPQGFELLARAETMLHHPAAAHLAQADYYDLIGETHLAIDQLHTARKLPRLDEYHAARIQARLQELTGRDTALPPQ